MFTENAAKWFALCLSICAISQASAQIFEVHGCKLPMVRCGNDPILCHVFANQATDMPDPRALNDPTASDEGPLEAKEWARRCYQLYILKALNNDANRAQSDSLANIYADLSAATDNAIPSVFSTIFYNPTDQPQQAAIVFVGALEPLSDEDQTDESSPSARYISDKKDAIFKSLAGAGLEKVVTTVPARGFAMKVYTPRNVANAKPGFYGAATLSLDQQQKVYLERRLVLLFGAFRRLN